MMFSYLSLPLQSSCSGLGVGDGVELPLDGGHGYPPSQVLGVVAGGGEDDETTKLASFCFVREGS